MKKDDDSVTKELISSIIMDFIGIPGRNTLRFIAKALGSVGKAFAPLYEAVAKGSGCGCFIAAQIMVFIAALAMNFAGSPYVAFAVIAVIFYLGSQYKPESTTENYHPRCPECIYFEDCKGGANFDIFKSKIFTLAKNPSFTEFLTKVPCTNQRIAEEPPPLPPTTSPNSTYIDPYCPYCIYFNKCRGGAHMPKAYFSAIDKDFSRRSTVDFIKNAPCVCHIKEQFFSDV